MSSHGQLDLYPLDSKIFFLFFIFLKTLRKGPKVQSIKKELFFQSIMIRTFFFLFVRNGPEGPEGEKWIC
jgi:hypothetical protein